jgi:TolA-binding protein
MLMNTLRLLLLLPVLITLGACELMQPAADDPMLVKLDDLERRMQAIERVMQNQSLVNLTQQVGTLERRNDEVQGRIETLEHGTETTADRQRQLYADLDARIQELESALSARSSVGVMEGGKLSPGQLPVPGGSDRDNYQAAFELLKEQRYEPAAMAFKQFLVYVTQQFDDALAAFEVVINDFPRSRKVPDALLKMGYCNYELKRWDVAREALRRVQADYPETTAARLAGQRLTRMEEEGV